MARLGRFSAFSDGLSRLFYGAANRRARRELGWKASSTRPAGSSRRRVRPCLEALEDRITPSATITVTDLNDDGSANSLRGAINQFNSEAPGSGTITIQLTEAQTYKLTIANGPSGHETQNLSGDLNINNTSDPLVIEGTEIAGLPATTIDQTELDRVFQVASGVNITFKNLIIEGGRGVDHGENGTATSTNAEGGGILDDGGNVTLSNVYVQSNTALAANGFTAQGGGIYVASGGSLTLNDSAIQHNKALGGDGVASNFAGNGGAAEGGGVYTSSPTFITDSNLSNNSATAGSSDTLGEPNGGFGGVAEGGGIVALASTTLTQATLSDNSVSGGLSASSGGGDAEGGGAFFGSQANAIITGSNLGTNTLMGGSGIVTVSELTSRVGGTAQGGGIYAAGGKLDISASSLSENSLTGGRGGILNDEADLLGDIGGDAEGGGIFTSGPTTITTSALSNNKLIGGNGTDSPGAEFFGTIGGSAEGGGLFSSSSMVTITASNLSGNSVTGGTDSSGNTVPGLASGGGAIFAPGSGSSATIIIVNSTIASNVAKGASAASTTLVVAGAGLFFGSGTTATLTNVTVVDNIVLNSTGTTNGGGIDNSGGTVTLVNTLVAGNSADDGPDFFGAVTNSDHNLISDPTGSSGFSAAHGDLLPSGSSPLDPMVGQLAGNGGPTDTVALLAGSPAINAGDNDAESVTGPFDQRGQGFARVSGGTIDIGAFEFQQPTSPPGGPSVSPPPPPASPPPPPTLQVPPLLAFFDAFLGGGVETINSNGTETVTDSFFGFPLLVSTFNSSGDLMSVTFFGLNLTALFELPL